MGLGCPLLLELSARRLCRCAATLPLFWKGHSQAQLSLQFSKRRRCGWRAFDRIHSSGLIRLEGFVKRRLPVYPSWIVVGRLIEGVVVRCSVRRFETVECTDAHWGQGYG